jgi:hypothetical protein
LLCSCLFFSAASFLFCVHNSQVLRYCKFALHGNSVCSPRNLHCWHLMRSVIVGGGVVEYRMHGCIDHVMFGGLWANNGYSTRHDLNNIRDKIERSVHVMRNIM